METDHDSPEDAEKVYPELLKYFSCSQFHYYINISLMGERIAVFTTYSPIVASSTTRGNDGQSDA